MSRPDCPKCHASNPYKNGIAKGKPRWKCRKCHYQFTRLTPRGPSLEQRAEVVKLYCSGISFNRIGKLKGTSHTTARRWVTRFAEQELPEQLPVTEPVRVVEMDEQWHFLQKK